MRLEPNRIQNREMEQSGYENKTKKNRLGPNK